MPSLKSEERQDFLLKNFILPPDIEIPGVLKRKEAACHCSFDLDFSNQYIYWRKGGKKEKEKERFM